MAEGDRFVNTRSKFGLIVAEESPLFASNRKLCLYQKNWLSIFIHINRKKKKWNKLWEIIPKNIYDNHYSYDSIKNTGCAFIDKVYC